MQRAKKMYVAKCFWSPKCSSNPDPMLGFGRILLILGERNWQTK